MILVLDLDDTLYPEIKYVESGMRAVAIHFSTKISRSTESIFDELWEILLYNGRGKVFDIFLKKNGVYSIKNVKESISIYRGHTPNGLYLFPDAERFLERISSYNSYLVTDGNKWVQLKKIKALKIENRFKKIFRTYQYGRSFAKPATHLFHKICLLENVKPDQLVYIGDNPNKDFVGLKKEGFRTIRIKRGMFESVVLSDEFEADITLNSLDEITEVHIKKVNET